MTINLIVNNISYIPLRNVHTAFRSLLQSNRSYCVQAGICSGKRFSVSSCSCVSSSSLLYFSLKKIKTILRHKKHRWNQFRFGITAWHLCRYMANLPSEVQQNQYTKQGTRDSVASMDREGWSVYFHIINIQCYKSQKTWPINLKNVSGIHCVSLNQGAANVLNNLQVIDRSCALLWSYSALNTIMPNSQ